MYKIHSKKKKKKGEKILQAEKSNKLGPWLDDDIWQKIDLFISYFYIPWTPYSGSLVTPDPYANRRSQRRKNIRRLRKDDLTSDKVQYEESSHTSTAHSTPTRHWGITKDE